MAGSRLSKARAEFEARTREAEAFVLRCRGVRHATSNRRGLTGGQIEWTAETAALKLVVASERFFEVTMALYALGIRAPSGYRPRRLRKFDSSLSQMMQVFKGDQDFIGWNDPRTIISRAERWLKGGEPYRTTLASASQLLSYLKKMRNAIAHESDSANDKYQNATRSLYGALPRRVCPGAQLISPPPAGIPFLIGQTLFDAAIQSYRVVAQRIVP
jgi:hypothetical protein